MSTFRNRLTFSLASLVFIFALAVMPAMAGKFQATYGTNSWALTITLPHSTANPAVAPVASGTAADSDTLKAIDVTAPNSLINLGTVTAKTSPPANTKQWTTTVPATDGTIVAVQLAGYQRVIFPEAASGAALAETDLVYLAKLKSVATESYALHDTIDIVFTFEAASETKEIGAPQMLHASDVVSVSSDGTEAAGASSRFAVRGVTGNNTIRIQRISGVSGVFQAGVSLSKRIAMPATTATKGQTTVIYDVSDPAAVAIGEPLDPTTAIPNGPETIPVNRIKPPEPSQWGAVDFDFRFRIVDQPTETTDPNANPPLKHSGLDISGIVLTANPDYLSFSAIGEPAIRRAANQYVTTVSTKNVDIDAGTDVAIVATVSDNAGNEASLSLGTVTLAAKTATTTPTPATLTAAPVSGSSIAVGDTIRLTFSRNPGNVTVTGSATTVGGSGANRTLTAPSTAGTAKFNVAWDGNANTTAGTKTLTYTVAAMEDVPATITVPAESYVLISKDGAASGLPSPLPMKTSEVAWAEIPDLENLLYTGGTLILTVTKAPASALIDHDKDPATAARQYATRDLVITEIMWALNNAKIGTADATAHQWIEVYNNLKVPVTATIKAKAGQPAPTAAATDVLLDRVSNVVGSRWQLTGLGQNGFDDDTANDTGKANEDFISMYRKERGKDGHVKGHWAQSDAIYVAGHKGTPGAKERTQLTVAETKGFTLGSVIINEVANRSDANKMYEWIELKGPKDTNLKKWQISLLTAVNNDKKFVEIPDKDYKIPASGILLLVASDPSTDANHPLAAGWDITKAADQQVKGIGADNPDGGRYAPHYIVLDFGAGLPDDGEFVLVLRKSNDKLGKNENIIDMAGWDDDLKISADESGYTNLWPLSGGVAKAEFALNKLEVDKVHRRQKTDIWGTNSVHSDGKADQVAFADVGWTGVGYKRLADATAAHGGTPGYENGTVKDRDKAITGPVTISEIMYVEGKRNLSQWIEIANPSATIAANINGWKLKIVNHGMDADGEDFTVGKLSEEITLPNVVIPPQQTFLVVARRGTNDTNLPSQRVHLLGKKRTEMLLNPYGFQITLTAKEGGDKEADKVGNLGTATSRRADALSYADLAWELPAAVDDDGNRISVVRVSKKDGTSVTGTIKAAWKLFNMSGQADRIVDATSYGHSSDWSSPGHTAGGVLPVSLSKFRPERLKATGEIVIRWVTESELNNAGFNILRSETRDGEFTKLNEQLILGQGTTSERTAYEWKDTTAKPNVVYYYQIQDVSLDGNVQTLRQSRLKGNVTPAGKLTTTWGELKTLRE